MRRGLPVWLLGLANLPLGFTGGVAVMAVPEVLAARHVPETTIANVTTLALVGAVAYFLVAPILDVHFSRRTYALAMTSAAMTLTFSAVLSLNHLNWLGVELLLMILVADLNTSALGGWFGSVLSKNEDATLGAWFAVASFAGFGVAAMAGIELIHHAPLLLAASILGAMNLFPLAIIVAADCPADERSRLTESFGRFRRELSQLATRSDVRLLALLFVLPCVTFALTNTLGGLGRDYHTSERLIAIIGGVGVTAAGVFGSLTVPLLRNRARMVTIYLGIGIVGAFSTLSMLALPRTPLVYTLGITSQNIWQSAGLAAGNALMLSSIGKDNPLAATQYAFLNAVLSAPLIYMQWIDGQAYGAEGLTGLYLADGGLTLAACALAILLLLVWWKRPRPGSEGAAYSVADA